MAIYTERSTQSWGNRLGGSFKGIIAGIGIFIAAFPLLFWNEGRSVKTHRSLEEGAGIVISVPADAVDSGNEGALVHVSGFADTAQILSDSSFGIAERAIKLRRTAEMYQWQETSKSTTREKIGGGTETITEYSYNKTWASNRIDSSRFKQSGYNNPAAMRYDSSSWTADEVSLGAFKLPLSLIERIDTFAPLAIDSSKVLPVSLGSSARAHGTGVYIGANPDTPQVGDIRVTFSVVRPTDISVLARQVRNTFEPYQAKAGAAIELLQTGTHSAESMIQKAMDDNKLMTWLLRVGGFLMMFIGLGMVFKPLSTIASVLPIAGRIVGAGTSIIAFLIALIFSLITIALAWVYYRPVLGISLLLIAAVAAVLVFSRLKKKKAGAAA